MELWRRIVDRVNEVGQHPRTRDDIKKRWNDLREKVPSMVSRHQIAVQRTGGGPPPPPPQLTTWEEQVLAILHPEGLAGVAGGMDSGNTSTVPSQRAHPSVPRTRQAAVCLPLQGTQANPPTQENQGPGGSGSGHTVQGTEAQDNRGTGRTAVRQGEDRPREPTLHEALSNIMGAYHHSQETMATVMAKFQETQRLQEEHYLGIREELKSINTTLVIIVGVLKDLVDTRRDTVAQQGALDTSLDNEQPTTSAGTSGQEALPQDHDTSTPPLQMENHPANGP
ncbi:hypothetical protein NDU88_003966 [Pleurodeles waltl]|uniref:Myb/SANT-like DNA-binding domain-containing protein n=1 Tax=Pleurodeles waltl TaxID=8319 RepID=A0AAV7UZZ4_PLEWA|nr:hypothetical protein NDU88_003966 [Pleurodeles waltl]